MLCADGKTVTSGIDSKGGDVEMFGYKDGTPLAIKKEILEVGKRSLKSIAQNIEIYEKDVILADSREEDKVRLAYELQQEVVMVGSKLNDSRELAFRQKLSMSKFKVIAGPSWRDSKYVYVI
jgi:hypothetical protein